MNSEVGVVLAVTPRTAGSSLATGALTGATVLYVDDAFDFEEGGGSLRIGATVLSYDEANPDDDTVTLSAPLTFDVDEELYVAVWDLSTDDVVTEYWATVDIEDSDGGDPYDAVIPYDTIDRVPVAIRAEAIGETVEIRRDDPDGEWYVYDVLGRPPSVDPGFVVTPHIELYRPAVLSIPNSVQTRVSGWFINNNVGFNFVSDGRVRINKTGTYNITATAMFLANGTGLRSVRISTWNGFTETERRIISAVPIPTSRTAFQATTTMRLEEGLWAQMDVTQTSGAALDLLGYPDATGTGLEVTWVGP